MRPVFIMAGLLAFYAVAFAIFTYPLITEMASTFISDGNDGCIFVWNIYNFTDSIANSTNPFFTDKIYYPLGSSLILHVYAPITGLVGLLTGNPVLALNVAVLASFILSGLGAYLLCDHYVGDKLLSALAGFVFAYCPYKLLHIYGHYDLIMTAGIPFFVLFWVKAVRLVEEHRLPRIVSPRNFMLAMVFMALVLASSYYYAYFLMIFMVLHIAYFTLRLYDFKLFRKRNLIYALIVILLSTGAVGLLDRLGLDKEGLARNGLGQSADILAFLVPSGFSRFLASQTVEHLRFDVIRANEAESTVYVGYGILVFALGYFLTRQYRREQPETKVLSFLVGGFLAFAMPVVLLADRIICALPTAFIHYIPFINNFRVPYRETIMIMLFLPILGALFIKRSVYPRLPGRLHLVLVPALIVILFFEYMQQPYPMVSRDEVPRVYDQLALEPEGTLLEIPFGLRDGFGMIGNEKTLQMYYQTIHHHRILGGTISRPNKEIFAFFRAAPIVGDLIRMEEDETWVPPGPGEEAVREFLEDFDIRYVNIYPEYRGSGIEDYLSRVLAGHITEETEIDGFRLLNLRSP